MKGCSESVVIDPLAFSMRPRGGVSRVWDALLPRFIASDVPLRLTHDPAADPREVFSGGLQAGKARLLAAERIRGSVRRFVPYYGEAGVFFPTWFRSCRAGMPNVQLVHDCIKELYYPTAKLALARFRRRRIYVNATAIIAISEATRLDLVRLFGDCVADRIRVIPNPVDVKHIQASVEAGADAPEIDAIGKQLGGRPCAMFIGYRGGVKNFRETRTLLDALPEHALVVVGPPPTDPEAQLARESNGRVLFAGALEDPVMFALLRRAEFLFWPSMLEGFGLPIVESLSLGTPVLALQTQINADVSLGMASYFETGSTSSLKAAVSRMRRLSAQDPGYHEMVHRYDPDRVAGEYLAVLRGLL